MTVLEGKLNYQTLEDYRVVVFLCSQQFNSPFKTFPKPRLHLHGRYYYTKVQHLKKGGRGGGDLKETPHERIGLFCDLLLNRIGLWKQLKPFTGRCHKNLFEVHFCPVEKDSLSRQGVAKRAFIRCVYTFIQRVISARRLPSSTSCSLGFGGEKKWCKTSGIWNY